LSINSAENDFRIAKAGYLPSLNLSISTSKGYSSAVPNGFPCRWELILFEYQTQVLNPDF
jgi:hypothetical protein